MKSLRLLRKVLLGAVAVLTLAPGAWAQGCALCYTSAAAAGAAGIHSLRVGILILLIPTLLLFVGVLVLLVYRTHAAGA